MRITEIKDVTDSVRMFLRMVAKFDVFFFLSRLNILILYLMKQVWIKATEGLIRTFYNKCRLH